MSEPKIATRIRRMHDWRGDAALYRCVGGPLPEHVVVSATTVLGTPETYIFHTTADGTFVSWVELDGSRRGTLQHEDVLTELGYKVEAGDG